MIDRNIETVIKHGGGNWRNKTEQHNRVCVIIKAGALCRITAGVTLSHGSHNEASLSVFMASFESLEYIAGVGHVPI